MERTISIQIRTWHPELPSFRGKPLQDTPKTSTLLVVDLDRLCDLAIENGQIASRVAAVVGQAKLLGLVLDRAQVEQTVVRVRDPDAPAASLTRSGKTSTQVPGRYGTPPKSTPRSFLSSPGDR